MKVFFYIFLFLSAEMLCAQRQTFLSRSELGVLIGSSYYIGDLNTKHFEQTSLSYGLGFRYYVHSRFALRGHILKVNLKGDDALSNTDLIKNRNLSFKNELGELSAGVEFNYVAYQTGHKRHKIAPYLFADLGMISSNPQVKYLEEYIDVRTLGTEGQASDLSSSNFYKKYSLVIPVGVGVKMSLGRVLSFSVEYSARKTFTDYLDDVANIRYVDRALLENNNGPLVANISNRSLDGSQNGIRGNGQMKDWYFMLSGKLTYRLGAPDKCFRY